MSVTFESLWSQYQPVVDGLAATYGAQNRRYGAEREDFSQEGVAWMLANEKWLVERFEEVDDPDEFAKFLARCLDNEFKDYSLDVRDQGGGQPRRGAYWYGTGELKNLLPAVFDKNKWLEPPQSDGKSVSDPAHGGNWIATLADVSRAFDQLSPEDQNFLRCLHGDGMRNKDMADMAGVTEATMSYRHTQALKRLLKHLGGEKPKYMRGDRAHDPWRGRHSVTNAHAAAMTRGQYEE